MADKIFPVSEYTKQQCVERGIPVTKLQVIHNGIDLKCNNPMAIQENHRFNENYPLELEGKKVLLTVGRLIKRKGHQWFIKNVMPKLGNEYLYLIAGEGQSIKISLK
jgi:glycosyltransferase involved in cell wall biosynthesis